MEIEAAALSQLLTVINTSSVSQPALFAFFLQQISFSAFSSAVARILVMKMEVLSVQNQFQGQFGVIGSNKVKDWASPLTPPPLPVLPPKPDSRHLHAAKPQNAITDFKNSPQLLESPQSQQDESDQKDDGVDVVDGRQVGVQHQSQQQQQQAQQQKQQHFYHRNQHLYPNNHYTYNQPNDLQIQANAVTTTAISNNMTAADLYAYSNDLLYFGPQHYHDKENDNGNGNGNGNNIVEAHFGAATKGDGIDVNTVNELSQRLQSVLRAAKTQHLACTEVSLPYDLTTRIAVDILNLSEREPCGIRGCTIFVEFENEPNNSRRIASLKVDPNTVSTFELYLTLKQDRSGWTSLLPQFLKNLTRSNTILISPDFVLKKNKLYAFE